MTPQTIGHLLRGVSLAADPASGLLELLATGVSSDSRRTLPGDLFFAFAGANVDGRQFASDALALGAIAIVSELPAPEGFTGPWIQVTHGRRALALASRAFYSDPTRRIPVFGVTGTNGKTTTAHLTDAILRNAGYTTAMFGTIEHRIADEVIDSINTTPESLELYQFMERLEAASGGPKAVSMEVSSHALSLGRVWGLHFAAAIWTNLTRDHLDFHGSMEHYFDAKAELFRGQDAPPPAVAAINIDDEYGSRLPLSPETKAWTYAIQHEATVRATNLHVGFEGLSFDLASPLGIHPFRSRMLGGVNVYNILGAVTAALAHGIPMDAVHSAIADFNGVPGRFERVDCGQPFLVIVDYAHSDDALRNVISVARALNPRRVITLFGCGGDRDRSKRPLMGMAAGSASDYVVLTSDNPRTEDPISIMNDALVGLRRYETAHIVEPDREKAIRKAIAQAEPGDIVLLAGKGHETYQILGKTKHPFDDRVVARHALAMSGYEGGAAQ